MSIRPSLTWMYLFPRDVAFTCDAGPEWFRGMVARSGATGEAQTRVTWGRGLSDLGDLSKTAGVVGVNCGNWKNSDLEAAGFTHISRFAVLPNIEKARWFVPLESAALSSGGLAVHTPARKSALLKHLAIRIATRTRLPLWYRDTICVAQREVPPLQQMLSSLIPQEKLYVALTSGAPEPAHNRKTSVAILDESGTLRAFAKVAGSPLSRRLLGHEADVLRAIGEDTTKARHAPRLLFSGDVEGRYMTVQTPLHGKPVLAKLTDGHRAFLDSLHTTLRKRASETAMVAELPGKVSVLQPPRPELASMLEQIMPVLERSVVPSTIVHGDFVPWNLRKLGDAISAFDWEYAELDGLPLADQTHFMVQDRYELDGWTPQQVFEELNHFSTTRPFGYDRDQVRAFQLVYVLDHLARLFGEKYDQEEHMVSWYRRLLCCFPVAAREAVLA